MSDSHEQAWIRDLERAPNDSCTCGKRVEFTCRHCHRVHCEKCAPTHCHCGKQLPNFNLRRMRGKRR